MALGVGDRLASRWEITGVIGSQERLFAARDAQTERPVVIRATVVPIGAGLTTYQERASALRGMPSTALERVVDWRMESGVFFLVVEETPGRSLQARVEAEGRLSSSEARRIAEVVLSVLRELHAVEPPVTHGDLSPAHLVERENGHLALVGFAPDPSPPAGADDAAPSTPVAADLHALGATLFFAVTGRSPPPLARGQRPRLPPDLGIDRTFAAWLLRLLDPDPRQRPQSAAAALAELRAPPRTFPVLPVAIGAGALLLVTVGLVVRARLASRAQVVPPPAVAKTAGLLPEPARDRFIDAKLVTRMGGHLNPVSALAETPDGKQVLSASFDSSVRAWSTADWTALGALGSHAGRAAGVGVTPDGAYAVSVGGKELRLYANGRQAGSAMADTELFSMVVSPKGSRVFAGGGDGAVRGWAIPSLTPDFRVEHEPGKRVLAVAASPDGKVLASAGQSSTIKLWDATTGTLVGTLQATSERPTNKLAFSAVGDLFAAVSDDGALRLWMTASNVEMMTSRIADTELWSVAFSPDGSTLYTGNMDGTVDAWWLPHGNLRWRWPRPETHGVLALLPSADGKRVFVGNAQSSFDVVAVPGPGEGEALPRAAAFEAKKAEPPAPEVGAVERARSLVDEAEGNSEVLDQAEKLVLEALAKDPRNGVASVELARIRRDRGYRSGSVYEPKALVDALETLDGVLRHSPALYEAHLSKARTLLVQAQTRRDPKGLAEVDRELALARAERPLAPEVLDLQADLALERGQLEQAETYASSLVKTATTRKAIASGYATLTLVYQGQKRFSLAEAAHRRLLELRPGSAWTHGNFAGFLRWRGRLDEAAREIEEALRISRYPAGLAERAAISAELGITALWNRLDAKRAKTLFDAALEDDPRNVDALYGRVAVEFYEATHKGERCRGCGAGLDLVLTLDPKHAAAVSAQKRLATP